MSSISWENFFWDVVLVGGVVGIVVGVASNFIYELVTRRARGTRATSNTQVVAPPSTVSRGWHLRKLLYILLGLAALILSLLLWVAFWYPLVEASVLAGVSLTHQILISPVSTFLYLPVCYILFYELLKQIVYYEADVQRKNSQLASFYRRYVLPLGITCGVFAILYAFIGWVVASRGFVDFNPIALMNWTYGTIIVLAIVWLFMIFLPSRAPFFEALGAVEPSGDTPESQAGETSAN